MQRIRGKLLPQFDARRLKSKLVGFESRGALIRGEQFDCFFPRRRTLRLRCWIVQHCYVTPRFHDQFLVRFLHREEVEEISKIVDSLRHGSRGWLNLQFTSQHLLARQRSRFEAGNMLPDRDRLPVLASGSMNDFVDHRPIVIGKVRAWLKYLLDRLFDHEGRSNSKPLRKLSRRERPSTSWAVVAAPGSG